METKQKQYNVAPDQVKEDSFSYGDGDTLQ